MHRKLIFAVVAACIGGVPFVRAQQPAATPVPEIAGLPSGARAAAASIDSEKIRAQRAFSFARPAGGARPRRAWRRAGRRVHCHAVLPSDGVEPAGDNGTYFQHVPLYAVHTIEEKTKFSLAPASGQAIGPCLRTEIVSKDQTGQTTATSTRP